MNASGVANDATQATASKRPTFKTNQINGHPCVRFDGSDDCLIIPSLGLYPWSSIYIVARTTSGVLMIEHGPNCNTTPGFYINGTNTQSIYMYRATGQSYFLGTANWFVSAS